jgi:hypothetical protein
MIQIQDLTKAEKLSSNALQAIQGGYSWFSFSYASSWSAFAPSHAIESRDIVLRKVSI